MGRTRIKGKSTKLMIDTTNFLVKMRATMYITHQMRKISEKLKKKIGAKMCLLCRNVKRYSQVLKCWHFLGHSYAACARPFLSAYRPASACMSTRRIHLRRCEFSPVHGCPGGPARPASDGGCSGNWPLSTGKIDVESHSTF